MQDSKRELGLRRPMRYLKTKERSIRHNHDIKKIDDLLCGLRSKDILNTLKFSSSDLVDPYTKLGTNSSTKERHKNPRLRNGVSYEKYFTIRIDPGISDYFNPSWKTRIGHTQAFKQSLSPLVGKLCRPFANLELFGHGAFLKGCHGHKKGKPSECRRS
jgi:hypothetical protein